MLNMLDPSTYIRNRVAKTMPSLAFDPPQHFRDPIGWQERLRPEVARLLGNLDQWETVPLDTEWETTETLDSYTRTPVTFASRPGLRVFGYYLVPDNAAPTSAAVICLPGHGRGVDSLVGIAEDGTQRKLGEPDEYQADFALQCLQQGYRVLAIEQFSFGRRKSAGIDMASSCMIDSMAALMLGETMMGWRVWDAMRAVDLLLTVPGVDGERIAVMGISGGGATALFTSALDTRITACVVSGYLNTFAGSILAVPHCVDNFVPGLLNVCDMTDVAGLIAPRPLFAESGTDDQIFPLDTFRQACARVGFLYMALGKTANFANQVFEGGHIFHGKAAFTFMKNVLNNR